MKLNDLGTFFSRKDLRNALMAVIVIVAGGGLAFLTLYAHRTEQTRLAGIAAALSLVFVILILIFVVPPLARNASREASQMNLPFEVTVGGAIVIGLVMIVAFSAWNTGNNLLFIVLSFLTAALIVGFIAGSVTLKKLDVKMRFPETIFESEETTILVSLNNRKRIFPSYSVVAEVRGNERESSVAAAELAKILPKWLAKRLSQPPVVRRTLEHFVHVPRNQTIESRSVHIFEQRGKFVIRDFEISTKFPFAFFRHRRRLAAKETELIVFPKLDGLKELSEAVPLDAGKIETNQKGSGQDLLALRDYQPSDDLRTIDWKATARSRSLIVREFAAEDDKKIVIFLDTRVTDDPLKGLSVREKIDLEQENKRAPRSDKFEEMVRTAAALIAHFTEEQALVRLDIGTEKGEPGIGTRHLHECLRRLAIVEALFVEQVTDQAVGFDESTVMSDLEAGARTFLLTEADEMLFSAEVREMITFINPKN